MAWWGGGGFWREYVPVARKLANAKKEADKLRKKGVDVQPVELSGRSIASSFWGKAWCDHMESFHDFANRLPRGRTYVRNGSVVHLEVGKGVIKALVAGSDTYRVKIKVGLLPRPAWAALKKKCVGQISSLIDLLKGKLSDGVMQVVTDRKNGLFPGPDEFELECSCPDYADMCKHVAAVLYGVGARLDARPELLFLLRGVDHTELAAEGGVDAVLAKGEGEGGRFGGEDLSEMFGIDLLPAGEAPAFSESFVTDPAAEPLRKPAASAAKPARGKGRRKALAASKKAAPPEARRNAAARRDQDDERLSKALQLVEEYVAAKNGGKGAGGKKARK